MGGRDVWHFQGGPKPSFLHASSPQRLAELERACNGGTYSWVGLEFTSPSSPYLSGTPVSLSAVPIQ